MRDYQTMHEYTQMRHAHPERRALDIWNYLHRDEAMSFEQFTCRHEWAYTGTAYGGDDESYMGEGRCYCIHCGADGDA